MGIRDCIVLLLCITLTSATPARRYMSNNGRRHDVKRYDDGSRVEYIEELEEDDLESDVDSQQINQPCVPQVPGLRCTTDICGDPAGIVRNCCQEFCGVNGPFRTFSHRNRRTVESKKPVGKECL